MTELEVRGTPLVDWTNVPLHDQLIIWNHSRMSLLYHCEVSVPSREICFEPKYTVVLIVVIART